MKCTLVVIALLVPLGQSAAQQAPVIQPKITELGTVIDSGGGMPESFALSPSGKLVAYTAVGDLRIWNTSTRSSSVLVTGGAEEVVWSRQGDALLFNRPDDQGSQRFVWTVRVDPATGRPAGTPQRVTLSPTTGRSPQFSPDGKLIAYPRWDSRRGSSLVIVSVTGGTERVLATGFDVRQMRWNGDGTSIYYATRKDSLSQDYYVNRVATSGGATERVHDASGAADAPRVTNDGRLVFPGPTLLDWSERTLKGMSGTTLATLPLPVDTWSDDASGGYHMIAVRESRPRVLRLVELASGRSHVLVDTSTASASSMAWFADGKRVAVLVRRNGGYALDIFNSAGRDVKSLSLKAAPRFQPILDGRWHSELTVSPDGRYAAYIGFGRASLELVDITSGEQRTLAKSTLTVTSPVWRPDSRALRYVRDGSVPGPNSTRSVREVTVDGSDRLVQRLSFSELPGAAVPMISYDMVANLGANATRHTIIRLDGKPPLVLPSTAIGWPLLSPDGTKLMIRVGVPPSVGTVSEPGSVLLLSLSDMSTRRLSLPENEAAFIPGGWSTDGKHFYLTGRNAGSDQVSFYSVPIDGGAPRRMARATTRERGSMFAVSPDGRYIAFAEAGHQRATFLSMDFTEGVSRLASSMRHE